MFPVLVIALIAAASPDYSQALALARRLVARHDYVGAERAYQSALDAEPRDAVAMSGRGYAKMLAGDRAGAKVDFEAALAWARTPREERMVRHNLALLDVAGACTVSASHERRAGHVAADVRAALKDVAGDLYDALEPDDVAKVCPGRSCEAPTVQIVSPFEGSAAFVMRTRPDGSVVVSPALASSSGGRCGGTAYAEIVSRRPLVVRAREEVDEDNDSGDEPSFKGGGCWITGLAETDYLLDPDTLDVLASVQRRANAEVGHGDDKMAGASSFANGVVTVTGCGPTQTVPLAAP